MLRCFDRKGNESCSIALMWCAKQGEYIEVNDRTKMHTVWMLLNPIRGGGIYKERYWEVSNSFSDELTAASIIKYIETGTLCLKNQQAKRK